MQNKLKMNYYQCMLGNFLIIILLDIFSVLNNDLIIPYIPANFLLDFIHFFCLNLAGSYLIFKPIAQFFTKQDNYEVFHSRLLALRNLSVLLIISLGIILMCIVILSLALGTAQIRKPTLFILNCIFMIAFQGFYTYFSIENFVSRVKKIAFTDFSILFAPQKSKIWYKLSIFIFIVVIFPVILEIVESLLESSTESSQTGELEDIMELIILIAGISIGMYFLARDISNPINMLLESQEKVRAGQYDDARIPVTTNDEIGELTTNFNRMLEGLKERDDIRNIFGKYVAPEVASEILKSNIKFEGEELDATVFFTDIENYTGICENLKPTEVVKILNEYFTKVVEIISEHGGIVNKFVGDSVFALFNVPIADKNHATNSIRAALKIAEYSDQKEYLDGIKLQTRIGINTAPVIVGNIGSKDRLEYTVIGDGVNIASRLEQLNKRFNTRILVGSKTMALAGSQFNFKKIDKIIVKGKTNYIDVFKIEND
jgi:class 3 adenylate cyclase